MAQFHRREDLMAAGSVLIAEVKAKRFESKAAVDAGLAVLGAANDFRADDGGPPVMFGASPEGKAAKPVAVPKTPAAAVKLAEKAEGQVPQGFGAAGDGAEAIGPLLPFLLPLAQFILGRLLDRLGKK